MEGVGVQLLGGALLLFGATGAAMLQRRQHGRPGPASVLAFSPFGVLIGAGAALIRGWDLGLSALFGAFVVMVVALVGDVLAARRRARSRRRTD